MMVSNEWKEINELIQKTSEKFRDEDDKEFLTSFLAQKAYNLTYKYSTDPTIIGMYNFLKKRAVTQPVISRKELKRAYNLLHSYENKFGPNFKEELGIKDIPIKQMPKEANELCDTSNNPYLDPILVRGLTSAFDNSVPYQPFSDELGKQASKVCAFELNCIGSLPKRVETTIGTENIIICKAFYNTPNGEYSIYIPIEIKNGMPLMPTKFMAKTGLQNISYNNIKQHLKDLTNTTSVVTTKYADKPVQVSKYASVETPNELKDFIKKFESDEGLAQLTFGKDAIEKGMNFIKYTLTSFGFPNARVKLHKNSKDTLYYAVAIDSDRGFYIPVKIKNGSIQEPKIAIASGNIHNLTQEGLNTLLVSNATEDKAAAHVSPCYDLTSAELIDRIKSSVASHKYKEAEDAINVLKNKEDKQAYYYGFMLYKKALTGTAPPEPEVSKCSAPVKVSNSKYLICTHTGLPLHKVYQDKNGQCYPLYRRGQSYKQDPIIIQQSVYMK